MSLARLPIDLIDLIFDLASEPVAGGKVSRDCRLYRNLCLVCRSFVPSARRFLYRQPTLYRTNWHKAIQLYEALASRNGHLGSLVRNLGTLAWWTSCLTRTNPPVVPLAFLVRGQSEAFSWMASMLSICPGLQQVSLTMMRTTVEVTKVVKSLSSSFGSLKEVGIAPYTDQDLDALVVKQFLLSVHSSKCTLRILKLWGPSHLEHKTSHPHDRPGNLCPLEELVLMLPKTPFPLICATQFLPVAVGTLRKIDLTFNTVSTPPELMHILRHIGPSLSILKLQAPVMETNVVSFKRYAVGFTNPVFPVEAIQLFPNLEHLTLSYFRALSVGRLESLAEHCPNLAVLDICYSVWIPDDPLLSPFDTPSYQAHVFPEHRVGEILSTFPRLQSVDLGNLPVRGVDSLDKLHTAMGHKDVALMYRTCIGRCPGCGDYHD
ncbi:hypothetical protein JCM3770_005002 [Rhodotorula araucariae]